MIVILIKCFFYVLTAYALGALVKKYKIKVNYTRKILHFSMLLIPAVFDMMIGNESVKNLGAQSIFVNAVITIGLMTLFMRKCRDRVTVFQTAFLSIDRPEDRPHTLLWLASQTLVAYLILILAAAIVPPDLIEPVIFMPLLVVIFGDGLAEPIGVRFGKHKYKTKALFSDQIYYRTLEGSACVLLTALLVVIFYRGYFSDTQFTLLLFIFPLLMAVTEAFSPHTWDTPFLLLVGMTFIYSVFSISRWFL